MTNEQCWILLGEMRDDIFWGRKRKMTVGSPASVDFDFDYVLKREEHRHDVIGFLHTHPNMPAIPSMRDHVTMNAWSTCLGKELLCCIKGADGLKVYLYDGEEDMAPWAVETVKDLGPFIIGVPPPMEEDVRE